MKAAIHKGGDSLLLRAAAALLFLAVCAYSAAFLAPRLGRAVPVSAPAAPSAAARLRGIAVRREQTLEPPPDARDGRRLPAGRGRRAGVFFAGTDGYESICPEDLETLDADGLDALLRQPPGDRAEGRLVLAFAWYYAAFLEEGAPPAPGACRLLFDGFSQAVPARLLSLRQEAGRTLLLFRLTAGGDYLRLRFTQAEIERS